MGGPQLAATLRYGPAGGVTVRVQQSRGLRNIIMSNICTYWLCPISNCFGGEGNDHRKKKKARGIGGLGYTLGS